MTDDKRTLKPQLWTHRPIAETMAIYADWAETYEAELTARGYRTPARIAEALTRFADPADAILDFGCGTGMSGLALRFVGFTTIDGTDITSEMLAKAEGRGIYRKIWLSTPGELSFGRGAYPVIVAAGVVSLGAAPPETLGHLVAKLSPGNLLAFSYNDPTLTDQSYSDALSAELAEGRAELAFREHGPHLTEAQMGSDVIILRRR